MALFFNYESQLKKMPTDHGVYEDMEKLYDSIMEKIQILADGDVLTSYEASTLFDAFKAVFEKLGDTNKTQKEVKTIMGEKILTFSADKIYNEGMEKGEEKGEKKGTAIGMDILGTLIGELMKANRIDDVCRASKDPKYRNMLLEEFGLLPLPQDKTPVAAS